MRELERTGAAFTVAFIPYNHTRSDARTVGLLRRNTGRFSITVHGCDHTGGEFASLDEQWLIGTSDCALKRMDSHRQKTQMAFDNIMVFPQGRFSTKAIHALKTCGFDAVVNTTPWPEDFQGQPLTMQDLLGVAVTHYSFPILCGATGDIFDRAFDAFSKAAVGSGTSRMLRHGYDQFSAFVRELATLRVKLVWMPLGETIARVAWCGAVTESARWCGIFRGCWEFRNSADESLACSFETLMAILVEAVLVNGKKVPFTTGDGLKYEAVLAPREEMTATILHRRASAGGAEGVVEILDQFGRAAGVRLAGQLSGAERVVLSFAQNVKEKLNGVVPDEARGNARIDGFGRVLSIERGRAGSLPLPRSRGVHGSARPASAGYIARPYYFA